MLAPSLCVTRNPSAAIANGLLHDNLADLGYVLVRDPVQNALRNFGPRVSLSATKSSGSPKLLAFVPLSMVYSVSAMLWLLAFESKINSASMALGPLAYGAIKTVGPAAVIEATEAAASTIIFSAFRDAVRSHNFALEMPQPPVFLTTAAMRLFATGLLQLGNVIAHVVFGRAEGMPIIVFGMVMLFLEWLGAVAQQAVANILMNESQESTVTNTDKKDQQEAWSNSIKLANR